jgi:UDP-glucose:glycoprotein glucosyltransferase
MSTGPSDHASTGDDDNEALLSDEIDPILSLLQNYPLNESAPDATVPLTEDELLSKSLPPLSGSDSSY